MKLKAKLKTLDGLNEAFHELYEKKGDEYVLKPIEGMDTGRELRISLENERNAHKETKTKLGTVTDKVTGLETENETLRQSSEGTISEAVFKIEQTKNEKLSGQLKVSETRRFADRVLQKVGADEKVSKLLRPSIERDALFNDETGEADIDPKSGFSNIDDYSKNITEEYGDILPGSSSSGDGADGDSQQNNKTMKRSDWDTKTHEERDAFMKDGGQVID